MKPFYRRLRAYIIGIALGIVMVLVIFKDRASLFTAWTPGNRVKTEIRESRDSVSERASCQLLCLGLSSSALFDSLSSADVNFKESQTSSQPKTYLLEREIHGSTTGFFVQLADSTALLKEVRSPAVSGCNCP